MCVVKLVGARDAVIALQTDSQMVSRFTPFEVPRWRESETFRRLLAAFERILPLRRPSNLAQREIVQYYPCSPRVRVVAVSFRSFLNGDTLSAKSRFVRRTTSHGIPAYCNGLGADGCTPGTNSP